MARKPTLAKLKTENTEKALKKKKREIPRQKSIS